MRQQITKNFYYFMNLVKVNVKGTRITQFWKKKTLSYGLGNKLSKNVWL